MADLVHSTIAAFDSSVTLVKTIKTFRSHSKRVLQLAQETESLSKVLAQLTDTVSSNSKLDLSALELPLERCSDACKQFEQEIEKCSKRSGEDRTSFRDWGRLRYIGDDIDGFMRLISGYKSTILIALFHAYL